MESEYLHSIRHTAHQTISGVDRIRVNNVGKLVVKKHIILRRKSTSTVAHETVKNEEKEEEDSESIEEKRNETTSKNLFYFQLPLISSIPYTRIQFLLFSQYIYSILYQYGLIPMPFLQLKQVLERRSEHEESSPHLITYKKRLDDLRIRAFVEEVENILQTLELWMTREFIDKGSLNSLYSQYLGIGFGPSINNLKKAFLLHFPSSLPDNTGEISTTQSEAMQTNRLKRIFVQKLIESESSVDVNPNATASRLKHGNMFVFIQLPQASSPSSQVTSSPELLQRFYLSDAIPSVSNWLNDYSRLSPHQQRQMQRKLSQVTVTWSGSTTTTSNSFVDHGQLSWLLLRKGVKVLKSSSSSFD